MTTSAHDTRGLIDRYYQFANAGDWESWCNLFRADQKMDEQLAGRIEGRDALRRMMKDFPKSYTAFTNTPLHVVVDGNEAAVLSHISAHAVSGATIEVDVCNYFQVADGEIAYMRNVHDTAPFASLVSGRP